MTKKDDVTVTGVPQGEPNSNLGPDQPGASSLQKLSPPEKRKLALPKGALIAFRKSGGLEFSSREVVIYPDGRMTYDARGEQQHGPERPRKLNDAQVIQLRRMLEQANFFRLEAPAVEPGGEVFTYEFTARLGTRTNYAEFSTGNVPPALDKLVERLMQLIQ